MDTRRLSTLDVLNTGILDKTVPNIREPEGREKAHVHLEDDCDRDTVQRHLDSGAIVDCAEYYGIPIAWRTDEGGYRGILLQYRNVTEEHDFSTVDEAADWFVTTAHAVSG